MIPLYELNIDLYFCVIMMCTTYACELLAPVIIVVDHQWAVVVYSATKVKIRRPIHCIVFAKWHTLIRVILQTLQHIYCLLCPRHALCCTANNLYL